jgi:hypothetical protein
MLPLYLKMNQWSGYIEELLLSRPELNDVYSRGSQVLKRWFVFWQNGNRIKEMKVSYIDGTKLMKKQRS